ncbi:MAG: hypothetical protein HFJ52_04585 [Clostridia bacterium]|nr:hypothetical protein [Clostridia bacterium]
MPRQIIPIGAESQLDQGSRQEKQVLTRAEMQELLEAWDKSNHSDLIVDEELLSKLKKYLEFQTEITKLRTQLARKIWEPYRVEGDIKFEDLCHIFINEKDMGIYIVGRTDNSKMGLVSLRTFKEFMFYFKEQDAVWIETLEDVWTDLSMYIAQKGGTFKYSEGIITSSIVKIHIK